MRLSALFHHRLFAPLMPFGVFAAMAAPLAAAQAAPQDPQASINAFINALPPQTHDLFIRCDSNIRKSPEYAAVRQQNIQAVPVYYFNVLKACAETEKHAQLETNKAEQKATSAALRSDKNLRAKLADLRQAAAALTKQFAFPEELAKLWGGQKMTRAQNKAIAFYLAKANKAPATPDDVLKFFATTADAIKTADLAFQKKYGKIDHDRFVELMGPDGALRKAASYANSDPALLVAQIIREGGLNPPDQDDNITHCTKDKGACGRGQIEENFFLSALEAMAHVDDRKNDPLKQFILNALAQEPKLRALVKDYMAYEKLHDAKLKAQMLKQMKAQREDDDINAIFAVYNMTENAELVPGITPYLMSVAYIANVESAKRVQAAIARNPGAMDSAATYSFNVPQATIDNNPILKQPPYKLEQMINADVIEARNALERFGNIAEYVQQVAERNPLSAAKMNPQHNPS